MTAREEERAAEHARAEAPHASNTTVLASRRGRGAQEAADGISSTAFTYERQEGCRVGAARLEKVLFIVVPGVHVWTNELLFACSDRRPLDPLQFVHWAVFPSRI